MVRTKTETRKSTGRKLPKDMSWAHRAPIVYHNNFFNDHTGKRELMSWDCCKVDGPIPPLASWVYYMVHPDIPQEFDGCAFHDSLTNGGINGGGPFRYEFFFLPGATAEECHTQFLGEMKARGTIWRQIRKVNRAAKSKKQESGEEEEQNSETESYNRCHNKRHKGYEMVFDSDPDQVYTKLPGLVWPKRDGDCNFVSYRGWFFTYHDKDTDCTRELAEKRAISLVTFEPIPLELEEGEVPKHDPMEHPIYSRPIAIRHEYFDKSIAGWMYNRMRANWEEEANEAMHRARKMGWTSW